MVSSFSLEILTGPRKGKIVSLTSKAQILGRGEAADIVVDDHEVSRRHCQISASEDGGKLSDLGSANGVFVNNRMIETASLQDGDLIRIGTTELRFISIEAPNSGPETTPKGMPETVLTRIAGLKWSTLVLLVMLAAGLLWHLLASWPLIVAQRQVVANEALRRAQALVSALAAQNQEALRLGDEMLLVTEDVTRHDGVVQAMIYDNQGRILAPLANFHERHTDSDTLRALGAEAPIMFERSRGVYDLAEPIRIYNAQTGQFEKFGTARILFSIQTVLDLEAGPKRWAWISFIVLLMTAFLLAKLIGLLTSRSVTTLRDDLEAVLKGDRADLGREYGLTALDRLAASIERCLVKLSASPVPAAWNFPAGGGETPQDKGLLPPELLAETVNEAVLVADAHNEILLVNAAFENLMGLKRQGLIGRHFFEAFTDQKILNKVLKLVQEATSSQENRAVGRVDDGTRFFSIQIAVQAGHSGTEGDYQYLVIVLELQTHGADHVGD
ncbi:MAG: FHA domain-containing protein [Deltaproteobacteria bacterium]|nr:FHA domain-containing protein [Deltaproteobacteria bacterium]